MADVDLWPIWTLPVANLVFCVADMVVANIDVIQLKYTLDPHYNTPHYNADSVITRL